MPGWEVRAFVSVPGRSVRPGRSPSVPGRGDSLRPVWDRIGDRYCRGRSGACVREFRVVTGLPGGHHGEAPHVKEAPQPVVAGSESD